VVELVVEVMVVVVELEDIEHQLKQYLLEQ
jgi:hypothetical protein